MNFKLLFIFILLFISIQNLKADPCYCENPDTHDMEICDCPIDGGASLLVGAGIAYGMKKIRDKKKSRKDLKDTI